MAEISTEIGELNITCIKGDSFNKVFTLFEVDGVTPINLTGYTAEAKVRANSRADAVLEFTSGGGATVNGPAGEVTLNKTSEQMGAVPAGSYVWTFALIDADSQKKTYLRGKFTVSEA